MTLWNQRVEQARKIAVIQGGLKHERWDLPPVIPHETTAMTRLRHFAKGTISSWHASRRARFIIHFSSVLRDEPALDFGGGRHSGRSGFCRLRPSTCRGSMWLTRIFARADAQDYLRTEIRIERVRVL